MVSLVSENQVMTRAGYVLFYRRRKMTVTVPSLVESVTPEEEEENRVMDTNVLEEQSSAFLTVGSSQDVTIPDVEGMADEGCFMPSNSPSTYSLPGTRIDMDTVD